MNEQNNPILEVKNLRVSYHTYAGEVKAVRGVQFSLESCIPAKFWLSGENPAAENL